MSQLINGFKDYQSMSVFFQKIAQELKKNGECNLGGNALLERFCKLDGVSDRRTIKSMFKESESHANIVTDPFINNILSIKSDDLLDEVTGSSDILNLMVDRWDTLGDKDWREEDILLVIKKYFNIKEPISEEVFKKIKEYFNQAIFFDVIGYKTLDLFNNDKCDSGDNLGTSHCLFKDVYNEITEEELDKYEVIWIKSLDGSESAIVTKDTYKKII